MPNTNLSRLIIKHNACHILYGLFLFLICHHSANAQMLVSTSQQNKSFLIEKGTGHVCSGCPGIERKCDFVLASHPGLGFLIEYHLGSDAIPQAPPLDYDFTTPYGDTISDPNKLNWPFYLNMMVNRRDQGAPYGSTFIFGQENQIQEEADTLVKQPSPVNLYLSSTFDENTRLLTVTAQAYYTGNPSTNINYLQIALTQDSVISTQVDADYPTTDHANHSFVFMNIFRDNLNGFEGDTINSPAMGRFVSRTYTYILPNSYKNVPCDPQHCNLTMYITEQKAASGQQSFTGKVITATRAKMGNGVTTGISGVRSNTLFSVYPNPTTSVINVGGLNEGNYTIEISDLTGEIIRRTTIKNKRQVSFNLSEQKNGIFYINVITQGNSHLYPVLLSK